MKIAAKKQKRWVVLLVTAICAAIVASIVVLALFYTMSDMMTDSEPDVVDKSKITTRKELSKTLLLPGAKTPIPLPIEASLLTRPDGQLILVNKKTPIDLTYAPSDLVLPSVPYRTDKAQEEVMVRKALIEPLNQLFASAKKENIELMIGSAYRSSKLQQTYFDSYVRANGQAEAEKYSAHPGTSEHQLGLAVDLTTVDRNCYLVECFAETSAGKWLAANAHLYGFILRYPKEKTDITGYNYEPWHFRYVGTSIATAIYESGLTYEEAFPYLSGEKKPSN